MFGVIKKAWDKVANYVFSIDTITYTYYCYEIFGRKCTGSREKAVGWVMFLTELKKGGYIDDETFELSLESTARWSGLSRSELLRLREKE